jgi:hypothetical protein
LHAATKAAVSMGWANSSAEGINRAVRADLERFTSHRALDEHFDAVPELRPDLGEVALAVAELQHSDLADQPELVRQAAEEIVGVSLRAQGQSGERSAAQMPPGG